jgi:adenosylmethionine-8-amino-7-oxononanoate aminotransferase
MSEARRGTRSSSVRPGQSHVLAPDLTRAYPVIERAEGVYLYDRAGRRYLDACGGAMVVSIGHGVPEVVEAIRAQVGRVSFVYRGQFTSEPAEALAALLADLAPSGFTHTFFVSGGSEANESAFKLARRYHLERGEPRRTRILSRWQSYHGNTLGALAATGHAARRRDYGPLLPDMGHIAPMYCYRCAFGQTYPGCRVVCADDLERALLNEGPENVAAFIAEPVVMTTGVVGAVPEYFRRIREICDRHGVLLIADEVITGFWRTGPAFACERWQALPDLITCGKGMSSGYAPLGAVLVQEHVVDAIRQGSGAFAHGYTFGGNPLSCAAGLAVLRYVEKTRLFERVAPGGEILRRALTEVAARHPIVGEVRVAGLLAGLELVSDRMTRAPFDPGLQIAARVGAGTLERGVVVYPVQGALPGSRGDAVVVAPPFTATEEHVGLIASALDAALGAVERGLRAPDPAEAIRPESPPGAIRAGAQQGR